MAIEIRGSGILVPGASGGIGGAIAAALADRGARLVLTGRDAEALDLTRDRCQRAGVQATVVVADLLDPGERGRLLAAAVDALGRVDVLVNSAGIPRRVAASRLTSQDLAQTMEVNYLAAGELTLAVLPQMLERGRGHIVTVGSVAGRIPAPREAAYAASKHALAAFMDCLATDLDGTGVDVSLVTPAVVDTGLWRRPGQEPAAVRGRGVPAQRVAASVVRLLERSGYEAYVPRHFRAVTVARALLGRWFLTGAARFDRRARRV